MAADTSLAPPPSSPITGLRLRTSGRSRADQLAEALYEQISSTKTSAGTLVGTLEDLRRESGLARATVSEAVRLLRERGVLEIRPGRGGGIYVADAGPLVRLRHTLLEVEEDTATVREAIELRDHLELLVDTTAAAHRTGADVVELRELLGRLRDAQDWDGFMAANWALHERIAAACPNAMARAVYVGTLGHLSAGSARFADDEASARDYRAERYAVHAELVEAIAAGDGERVRVAVARHTAASAVLAREEQP